MPSQFLPNAPFVNYFFKLAPDPTSGANVPNASGTLTFYEDDDHTVLLSTYSDVSDPDNPVVNTNPIVLGADGAAPLIYLQDALYYIVENDSDGAVIRTYEHFYSPWNGGENPPTPPGVDAANLLADGQFSFPLYFWQSTDPIGKIPAGQRETAVAWGWLFLQDPGSTTNNVVTFDPIFDQGIPSNPLREMILTSDTIQAGETLKEFHAAFGVVNFNENGVMTFSFYAESKLGGTATVNLLLQKYYGAGGSPSDRINLTTFTVTQTRQQYVYTFTLPDNAGKTIGDFSTIDIVLQVSLGQICSVGFTNTLLQTGTSTTPIYPPEGLDDKRANVVGYAFVPSYASGLETNYQRLMTVGTNILQVSDTGKMFIGPLTASYPDATACDGTVFNVSGYSNGIPLSRLHSAIGQTYGGAGDLISYSSGNVVTFTLAGGGRELSPYSAGTTGFTIAQTQAGLPLGVTAALTSGQTTSADITFIDDFAPQRAGNTGPGGIPLNVIGAWYYAGSSSSPRLYNWTSTDINVGSGAAQAISRISFTQNTISNYKTSQITYQSDVIVPSSFLEFASVGNNVRGQYQKPAPYNTLSPMCIVFSVDGSINNTWPASGSSYTLTVQFFSFMSLAQNVAQFIKSINIPFIDTVTINSVPAASQYFLGSSDVTNYCFWYKVDGAGSEPTPPGFSGTFVEIDISSSFTTTQVATATANAANNLTFAVPSEADLPEIPNDKSFWFINL